MITMSGSNASNVLGPIRVYASGSGGDIIVTGNLVTVPAASGAGEILLKADDALAINSGADLTAGNASNITLRGSTLTIADTANTAITGTANLYIEPGTASTIIGVGSASASGTLRLPQSYFWNGTTGSFRDGFSQITIGRSDGTGSIFIGDLTYSDPLLVRNDGSNRPSIQLSGALVNAGAGTSSGFFKALAGGTVALASGSSVLTSNSDIVLNSASYDGSLFGAYGITLSGTSLSSSGGAIRLGGGTARDGTGYAPSATNYNGIRAMISSNTINSGGGAVSIRAQSPDTPAIAVSSGSLSVSSNFS